MFFGCKKDRVNCITGGLLLCISSIFFSYPFYNVVATELPLCSININQSLAPDIYFDFKQSTRDGNTTLEILKEKYGEDIIAEPDQTPKTTNLFKMLKYDGNNVNTVEFSVVDFNKGDAFICDINKLTGCNETTSEADYIEKQESFVEIEDQIFNVCGKDWVKPADENGSGSEGGDNGEVAEQTTGLGEAIGESQETKDLDKQMACLDQQTGQITCGVRSEQTTGSGENQEMIVNYKCDNSGNENIKELYCDNGICSPSGNFSITVSDNKYIVKQIKNCFPKNHICYFYRKDIDLYYMVDKHIFDPTFDANKSFYIYEKDASYGNNKNEIAGSFKLNCAYDLFKCDFSVLNESNKIKEKNVVYLNSSVNADNRKFVENINSGLGKMAFFRFLGSCNYDNDECREKVNAENYYKYINPITKVVYYFEKNFRSQKGVICDGYLPNCKDVLQPVPLYNDVVNSDDNNRQARDDFYLANADAENRATIRTAIKGENKTSIGIVVNEANMWFINSNNFANSNCLSIDGKIIEPKNGKPGSEVYNYKGYCSDLTEDRTGLMYPTGYKNGNCYFKSCIDLTPEEIRVILSKGGSGKFCSEYTWLNNKYGFKYFPKESLVFCNEILANGDFRFPQGFEVNNPKCYLKNCFSIDDNEERNAIIYSRYEHFLNKVGWVYNVGKYADGTEHNFSDYYYAPKYCHRGIFFTKDMVGFGEFSEANFNVNFCNDFSLEQLSSMNNNQNAKDRFIGPFSKFFSSSYNSDNTSYFCRTHIVPYSVQQESNETSFLRNTLIGLDERKTENIKDSYKTLYNSLYQNIGGYEGENLFANNSQHSSNLSIDDSSVYGKIESSMIASNPEFNSMTNYCYSVDNLFLFQDTTINNLSNRTYSIQVANPYRYVPGQNNPKETVASVEVVTFNDKKNNGSFIIANDSGFGNYLEDLVAKKVKEDIKDENGNVVDTRDKIVYETTKRVDSAGVSKNYSYYEILVNRVQNKAVNYKGCILSGKTETECKRLYNSEAKYYDVEDIIFQNLIDCSMYNSNYNTQPLSVISYFDCDLYSSHGRPYSLMQPYFTKLYPIHKDDSETYNNFVGAISSSCDRLYTIPEEKNTVVDRQNMGNNEVLSALMRPYISTSTQSKYLNDYSTFESNFKKSSSSGKFKSSDRGLAGCSATKYSRSDTIGLRYPRKDSLYFAYGEKMIDKTTNNGAIIPAGKKFFNRDFKYNMKLCLRESKESDKCGKRESDKYNDKCVVVSTGDYIDTNGIYSSGDSVSTTTDTYYSSIDTGRNVYYIQRVKANDFMNATESSPYLDFMAIEKITDLWGDLVYMGVFAGMFVTTLIGMSAKCAWDAIVDECKFNPVTVAVDMAKYSAAATIYTTFLLPRKNEWYAGYEGTLIYPYNYYNYIKEAKKERLRTDAEYAEQLKAEEKDVINTKEVDVEEGYLTRITLTNNDNYYYNYYPRSLNIAEDIRNKLTYNVDSGGRRFFHKTSRSYDILKHCGMTDMLIDKNDCLNDRVIPDEKKRSVNADDFMDILIDKMWRAGCTIAKPFIKLASYIDSGVKDFQCYENKVIWKGQSDCDFGIKNYNTGGECTVNGDYTKCLTGKQKKCLDSFGVEFLDLDKLLDPRYKDFESKSVFKRYEELSTYDWFENQKKIITLNFASTPNELYQVPVNVITLSKYNGREENLVNNENCLLNQYGSPIGDLAKCRGIFYSSSQTELNGVNQFAYKTYEAVLPTAEMYEIDDEKGSDADVGTFYTESQAVSKPLASSPPLFFNLVTPNNIPEIFLPIFFLKRFRNYRDVVKDATYIDSAVLDFFNPQLHFLYDYQQSNDIEMENKYSDYYEKNNGKATRHLIDFGRQYSNPYLLKYLSKNGQRSASFRFILEKKYDGDFNKTYSPTVCTHMTILPSSDGVNSCLMETKAPIVGSPNTSFIKEEVKLCGADSNYSCGNFDDVHQSGSNSGKCVSAVYNDYYCYARKLPDLKTNFIIKQDPKINYLFPVINAFIKPSWNAEKEKRNEGFSDFNKSEYILSRFSTGVTQEVDVKTSNMTQISDEAINYTQAIGLKFERSVCSAMTYEYYKYTDMLLKEKAKNLDEQDTVKIQKYQDKVNYFDGLLQPECDRLDGYRGQILVNDSTLLPYRTVKDISKVVYMETKPIRKNPSMYGAFNEICLADSIIEHFDEAGSLYNPTLLENVIVFKNLDSTSVDKTKCLLANNSLLNSDCLEDDIVYEYCDAGTFNCERRFNLTKNEFEYVRKIECKQLMEKLRDNIELWEFNVEDIRACYKGGFNMNGNVYKKDGSGPEYSCSCRYEKDMMNYNKDLFKVRKITARELGFCVNLEDAPTCPAVKYYGSNKEYVDDNLALGKTDEDYTKAYRDGDTSIYEQHIWRTNEMQFGYIPSVFFSNNLGNAEFEKSNYCSNDGEGLVDEIKVNCNPKTRNISKCESQLKNFFDSYSVEDKSQQNAILLSCKSNEAGQYSICTNALDSIDSNYSNNMCIGGSKITYGDCNGYWNINVNGLRPQAICSKYDYINNGKKRTVYEYRLISNPCERYRCEGIGYYDSGRERAVDERDAIRKTSTLFRDDEIDAYNQKVTTKDFNIPYVDEETDISKVDKRGSSNGFAIWPETVSGDMAKKTTATQCLTGYGARETNYNYNTSLDNGFSHSYYIDHTMVANVSINLLPKIYINCNPETKNLSECEKDLSIFFDVYNVIDKTQQNSILGNCKGNLDSQYKVCTDTLKSISDSVVTRAINEMIELEKDKTDFMSSNIFPVTQRNLPFRYCDQKGNWMVVNDIYNKSNISQDKMYYYRNNTFWENRTKESSMVDASINDNGYYCERLICKKMDKDYINNENVYSKEYLNAGEIKTFDKIKFWKHSGGAIWDTVGASRNSSNLLNTIGMFDKANMNLKYVFDNTVNSVVRSEYKYIKRFNEGVCYTDFGYFNRGTEFQGDGSFSSQISILLGTQDIREPIKPQYTPMIMQGIKTFSPERACDSNGTWTGVINNCFRACEMLDIYRTNVSSNVMENNLDNTKYIENHNILSIKVDKYNADTEKVEKEQKFTAYGLGTKQELIDLNKVSGGGYYYGDFATGGATWPRTIVSNNTIDRDKRNGLRYVEVEGICDASYEGDRNKIRQYINSADSKGNTIKPKRRCYEDGTWGAVYDNTQCALAKSCVELQITLKNLKQLIDAYNSSKSLLEMNDILANDIVYDNERKRCVVCENIDMINNKPNSSINDCAVSHSLVTNGSMAKSLSDENNMFYVVNAWEASKQNFVCNRSNQNNNYQPGWNIKSTNIDEYFIPKTCDAQVVKNKSTVSTVFKDGLKSRRAVLSLYPTKLSYIKETNLEFISKNATLINSYNQTIDNIHYYGRYYNNPESKVNYLRSIAGNTGVKDRSDRNIKIGRDSYESFQIVNYCDRSVFYNKLDFDGYVAKPNDEYYDKNIVLECRLDGVEKPKYNLLKDESRITREEKDANLYPEGTYISAKDAKNIITDFDECLPMSCGNNTYQFNASVSTVKEFSTDNYGEYGVYGRSLVSSLDYLSDTHTSEIRCDGDGYAFIIDANDPDGRYDTSKAVYYDINGDTSVGKAYHFVKKFTGLTCNANKIEKNKINGQIITNGRVDYDGTYYDYQRYGELDVSSIPKRFCKDLKKGDTCKTLTKEEILSNKLVGGGNFKNEYCVFIGCRMNNLVFNNSKNDGNPTVEIPTMNKVSTLTTFSLNSSASDNNGKEYYGTNSYSIYKSKIGAIHILESLQGDYTDAGNNNNSQPGIKSTYTLVHKYNNNYKAICGANSDIYFSGSDPYTFFNNYVKTSGVNQDDAIECFNKLKDYDDSLKYLSANDCKNWGGRYSNGLCMKYIDSYASEIDTIDSLYNEIETARTYKKNNLDTLKTKSKNFIMENIVYPFFENGDSTYIFDDGLIEHLTEMKKTEREKINRSIFIDLDDLYSKYSEKLVEQKNSEYQQQVSSSNNNSTDTEDQQVLEEDDETNIEQQVQQTSSESNTNETTGGENNNNSMDKSEEEQWFIVRWDDGTINSTDELVELPMEENSNVEDEGIRLFKEFLDDTETIEDYKLYYVKMGEVRKYYIGRKFNNITVEIRIPNKKENENENNEQGDDTENQQITGEGTEINTEQQVLSGSDANEIISEGEGNNTEQGSQEESTETNSNEEETIILVNGEVLFSVDMYYSTFKQKYDEKMKKDGTFMRNQQVLISSDGSSYFDTYNYYVNYYAMEYFFTRQSKNIDLYNYYIEDYKRFSENNSGNQLKVFDNQELGYVLRLELSASMDESEVKRMTYEGISEDINNLYLEYGEFLNNKSNTDEDDSTFKYQEQLDKLFITKWDNGNTTNDADMEIIEIPIGDETTKIITKIPVDEYSQIDDSGVNLFIGSLSSNDSIDNYEIYYSVDENEIKNYYILYKNISTSAVNGKMFLSASEYSNQYNSSYNAIVNSSGNIVDYYILHNKCIVSIDENTSRSCSSIQQRQIENYFTTYYEKFLNNKNEGGADVGRVNNTTCENSHYKRYLNAKQSYTPAPAKFRSGLFMALQCTPNGWDVIGQPTCKERCWGSVLNVYDNGYKLYSCDSTIVKTTIEGLRYSKSVQIPTARQYKQYNLRTGGRDGSNDWVQHSKNTFSCWSGSSSNAYQNVAYKGDGNNFGKNYSNNIKNSIPSDKKYRVANVAINFAGATAPRNRQGGNCCMGSDKITQICVFGKCCCRVDWCMNRVSNYTIPMSGYGRSGNTEQQSGCRHENNNKMYYMCPDGSINQIGLETDSNMGMGGCISSLKHGSCSSKYEKDTMSVKFEVVPAGKYSGGTLGCDKAVAGTFVSGISFGLAHITGCFANDDYRTISVYW